MVRHINNINQRYAKDAPTKEERNVRYLKDVENLANSRVLDHQYTRDQGFNPNIYPGTGVPEMEHDLGQSMPQDMGYSREGTSQKDINNVDLYNTLPENNGAQYNPNNIYQNEQQPGNDASGSIGETKDSEWSAKKIKKYKKMSTTELSAKRDRKETRIETKQKRAEKEPGKLRKLVLRQSNDKYRRDLNKTKKKEQPKIDKIEEILEERESTLEDLRNKGGELDKSVQAQGKYKTKEYYNAKIKNLKEQIKLVEDKDKKGIKKEIESLEQERGLARVASYNKEQEQKYKPNVNISGIESELEDVKKLNNLEKEVADLKEEKNKLEEEKNKLEEEKKSLNPKKGLFGIPNKDMKREQEIEKRKQEIDQRENMIGVEISGKNGQISGIKERINEQKDVSTKQSKLENLENGQIILQQKQQESNIVKLPRSELISNLLNKTNGGVTVREREQSTTKQPSIDQSDENKPKGQTLE